MVTEAAAKAQVFAHRLVEFADAPRCEAFFRERGVDLDQANEDGWSVLMSVCACGRDDLVGFVLDRTSNVTSATAANRTTALHLAAMATNPRVLGEMLAAPERCEKLKPIVDTPNINGDTPLMMACVAKNDVAVQMLLEELGANPAYVNASGMSALMCSARLSVDMAVDVSVRNELMQRSGAIVRLLLAHGAQADVAELAAGNTALHFAVMSDNDVAVESLLKDTQAVDSTVRNKAGLTALELGKRANASAGIVQRLQQHLDAIAVKRAERSTKAAEELLAQTLQEPKTRQENEKPSQKKRRSKNKQNNGAAVAAKADEGSTSYSALESAIVKTPVPRSQPSTSIKERNVQALMSVEMQDKEPGTWHSVESKKSRRKLSAPDSEPKPRTAHATSRITRDPNNDRDRRRHGGNDRSTAYRGESKVAAPQAATPQSSAIHTRHAGENADAAKPTFDKISTPRSETTRRAVEHRGDCTETKFAPSPSHEDNAVGAIRTYDQLNAAFERSFPIAGELEIGVENFLIGSAAADRELQPDGNLSISQVEALQDAHWQAYHYLNEKKLELTRRLETQRLEAQFALQQEIMHLD